MAPEPAPAQHTLEGRHAVVSGAARGIGLAVTRALLAAGCRVVAFDLEAAPLEHPGLAGWVQGDVACAEDVARLDRAVAEVLDERLDVLVCNAGLGVHERLVEGDPAAWARVLEVNVLGTLRVVRGLCWRAAGGPMLDVVITGSMAAKRGYAWGGVYSASKSALERIAESLREELRPRGRVTTVAPGLVTTPFFTHGASWLPGPSDLGCAALRPADVAEAMLFALTRPATVAIDHIALRPIEQPPI